MTVKLKVAKVENDEQYIGAKAVDRILVKDKKIREEMGKKAMAIVESSFLMTRFMEHYLDLFNSIGTKYTVNLS